MTRLMGVQVLDLSGIHWPGRLMKERGEPNDFWQFDKPHVFIFGCKCQFCMSALNDFINLGWHLVFSRFKLSLSLFGASYADFCRHDTGKQFWSGCISLHQASRISCPLDSTVTICHCGHCFSLFHSTLLEGDRAARGRSLFEKNERENEKEEKMRRNNARKKTQWFLFTKVLK